MLNTLWTRHSASLGTLNAELLASAAMDCLLHNAVVVMDGDTYRNPPPAKKARRGNGRSAAG